MTSDDDDDAAGGSATEVLRRMTAGSGPAPTLGVDAATPLRTLPPELVALIVTRTRAGLTAFGDDHPRRAIVGRILVPSGVLVVLDAIALVVAAVTGHGLLVAVAAVLLVVLGYITVASERFVRTDPLRVTSEQRADVQAAKVWRSGRSWSDAQRTGPWGRLLEIATSAAARIAASDAWTWASIGGQRAATELAPTLDDLDAHAFDRAEAGDPAPSYPHDDTPGASTVRRVAALLDYADALDDLTRRAVREAGLRAELPAAEERRLTGLLAAVRGPGGTSDGPS